MVKIYDNADDYSGYNKKRKIKVITEEEGMDGKSYFNIWDVNPSYKDISRNFSLAKTIFLIILFFSFTISIYILTNQLFASIGLGIGIFILFILVFHDEIYILKNFFLFYLKNKVIYDPFEDLVFW